jgi:phenylalanyl-tRNA synthetase beta chain
VEGEVADLAAVLSALGLVVDGVERVGEGLDDVVVARVLATRRHPGADQVQLVDVDPGDGSSLQVVCGAFNFGPGDLVPLAPVGAKLPGDVRIGRRKVRGEWSDGMLCSPPELALPGDAAGILVLPPGTAPPGSALADALGIRPDVVFDLDVTPNRPDAMCVAGVARDLAARLGLPFRLPDPSPPGGATTTAGVAVDALDLCPRFTATVLEGVHVGPSPAWLANRLTLAGMRPVNNVVDVSNYVMLELGQPNHPYDLDLLAGRGLLVRRAGVGERLATLDGVERLFEADDCLICDAEGGAVGVGGIMGGASTVISPATTTVVLEAAWFSPVAIARTSKRLGLRTEASVRFERGVDPDGIDRSVGRYCELVAEVAGAPAAGDTVDVRGRVPEPSRVVVRTDRLNALLGTSLSTDEVRGYLEPIGFECSPADDGDLQVSIPSWRPDSQREIDVVEEVARHHGYSSIARTLPPVRGVGGLTAYQRDRRRVREILVGAGLTEAWATSFLAPGDLERAGLPCAAVELENPLVAEESVLRTSLLPGLLRAVVTNQSHRNPAVSLFEIGHVFLPPRDGAGLPEEPEHLAVALAGGDAVEARRVWDVVARGLRLDAVALEASSPPALHATRSATIAAGGTPVGVVGEVDVDVLAGHGIEGRVGWLQLDLGPLLAAPRRAATYRPVSRFPSADVDLAFVVEDPVPAAAVEATLRQAGGDVLEDLWLFDVFRGPGLAPGRRSLAYRLRFSALDHTLSDTELAALRRRCIEAVEAAHTAQLRG